MSWVSSDCFTLATEFNCDFNSCELNCIFVLMHFAFVLILFSFLSVIKKMLLNYLYCVIFIEFNDYFFWGPRRLFSYPLLQFSLLLPFLLDVIQQGIWNEARFKNLELSELTSRLQILFYCQELLGLPTFTCVRLTDGKTSH